MSVSEAGANVEFPKPLEGVLVKPSNLIIIGAPLRGKREFAMQILRHGLQRGEGAVYVSTSHSAEEVRGLWVKYGFASQWEQEGRAKFVDCYSKMLGIPCTDTESIYRVPSLLDHTKLMVKVTELCSTFLLKNIDVRVVVDSLSSLLMYSSLQTVLRFLHIFLGQLRTRNALTFFLLDEGAHDEITVNTLKSLSDGVIRMNAKEKTIEFEGIAAAAGIRISYEITENDVFLTLHDDDHMMK